MSESTKTTLTDGPVAPQKWGLNNPDLRPLHKSERTWTWWNYSAIWMGIVHNLVAWQVAANLIAVGLSFWQACACVMSSYAIAFGAMIANSVMGAKYGLPFPVLIRAAFGRKGAQIPVFLRALVAVFWFAVHTYIGSQAIGLILSKTIPGYSDLSAHQFLGMGIDVALAFLICWLVHVWVLTHGLTSIRKFENWAGPLIMAVAISLVVWAATEAGGFGALFDSPQTVEAKELWPTFILSMTALIGTVSSLVLNISDLTRQSRSQRDHVIGQGIGMPIMFGVFSFMALLVAVGTKSAFGEVISDPLEILARFENPFVGVFAAACILVSTVSVNVATNGVSVGFDLTNLFPKYLTFRRSGVVAIVSAVVFVPWLWYGKFDMVEVIVGAIGSVMGPVAGIMLVDYYFIRRRKYDIASLFTSSANGRYAYHDGWNLRALIALAVGVVFALLGLVVPVLSEMYAYNWFIGIIASGLVYLGLMWRARTQDPVANTNFADIDEGAIEK